jgi:hypothetical protein
MTRGALLAWVLMIQAASAQTAPANTLQALFTQIGDCIGPLQLHSGTAMSIRFSLRRDGSMIGKPRVTYLHTPKDEDVRDEDLKAVADAFNRCLPARITPALGGAIAGQPITFSFLPAKHEQKA